MVQRRERDHRLRLCRCHLSTFQQLLGGLRGEKRLLLARNHRFYAVSSRFHRPKEVLLKLCAFGVTEFFLGPERVPLASCLSLLQRDLEVEQPGLLNHRSALRPRKPT